MNIRKLYIVVLIPFLAGCASMSPLKHIEKKVIYYPSVHVEATPQNVGLYYQDVYLKTMDGVTINGWWIPADNARSTILFFHGNAGNISHRLDKIAIFNTIGLNVFIVDYRGYGRSEGSPTEQGLYMDAVASYEYLLGRDDLNSKRIVVYGESLGGAIAINLATKKDISALIIDSSFTSIPDMAKKSVPLIPGVLINTKMNSIKKVDKIEVPKLFIHSLDDEVVPYDMGEKLFNTALEPKKFLKLNGGHNDGFHASGDKYMRGISKFLREHGLLY